MRSLVGLFILCAIEVSAETRAKNRGISLQGEAGLPYASIKNPDNTFAYYRGVGLQGRVFLPVIDEHLFSFNLVGSGKYLDLTNSSNNSRQKEVANLIGPGLGVNVMLWKLFAGIDYQLIYGRHYGVGAISRELNYSYGALQQYYGLQWEFGALMVGLSYSSIQAKIPKSQTGLSVDSDYAEQIYWIHFRYSSGFSLNQLLKVLFKN